MYTIARQFPRIETADFFLPSKDGSAFYRFDPTGKHLDTRDTATGAALVSFGYDTSGRLATITDRAGNVTRVEHDASGQPIRIVAPFGQTTELGLDPNGFLSDIVDPLGGVFHSEYSESGLMASFRDPRGGTQEYSYDALGRLNSESGPDAASKVFTLSEASGVRTVTSQTALGRTATYRYESLSDGDVQRDVTVAGLTTTTIQSSGERTTIFADGTMREEVVRADPRFGMLLPFPSETVQTTPSGLTLNVLRSKTFSGVETGFSETIFTNGKPTNVVYDAATKTRTTTSPAGRVIVETLDDLGRASRLTVGNLVPVDLTYDPSGRVLRVTRGPRPPCQGSCRVVRT
jgi:YD repeat-containing protein